MPVKPMLTVLFLGDVVGKIGRKAVAAVLPQWRDELRPDLVIANAENIAHGSGVTEKTLQELIDAGVEIFTSGNHVFDKPEGEAMLSQKNSILLRPINYPAGTPGVGLKLIEAGSRRLAVLNLIGRSFIKEAFDCPFRALDAALASPACKKADAIIVDFHAETTSEKAAFGWYAAGRVAAVLGTHTHVPTADARVLPPGTAFVTDVGMAGATDSVIGVGKDAAIAGFLTQRSQTFTIPESGEAMVNAVVLEIDPRTGKAESIKRLDKIVTV